MNAMLATLNNEQLFLREIKRNLSQEDTHAKNNEKSFWKLLLGFGKSLVKVAMVNIELRKALNSIISQTNKDYDTFLKSDHTAKEDMLIKWEKLGRALNTHMKTKPKSGFLSRGIVKKTTKILDMVNDFSKKLDSELYPAANQKFSQEYLEKLSKNFEHLPKDIMDDLTSEQQLECV
jgi:hypothetical protein